MQQQHTEPVWVPSAEYLERINAYEIAEYAKKVKENNPKNKKKTEKRNKKRQDDINFARHCDT